MSAVDSVIKDSADLGIDFGSRLSHNPIPIGRGDKGRGRRASSADGSAGRFAEDPDSP